MKTHELKCWPEYFEAVSIGLKKFEYRKNDRNYRVGDFIKLREYNPSSKNYSGRELLKQISYIANAPPISFDYCVLGFISAEPAEVGTMPPDFNCWNCNGKLEVLSVVARVPHYVKCAVCNGSGRL